jgi:hypothetical protein
MAKSISTALSGRALSEMSERRIGASSGFYNKLVYEQLPKGVLEDLRRKNPVVYVGASGLQRKNKHHQWLTDDVGDPHLRNQISQVLGIMRAARNKG